MTVFGVRPDSRSRLARKIEGIVEQRKAARVQRRKDRCEAAAAASRSVFQRLRFRMMFLHGIVPHKQAVAIARWGQAPRILRNVAKKHRLSPDVVRSDIKTQRVFKARAEAAYEIYTHTSLNIGQIGNFFHRDHTSIGLAIGRYAQRNALPDPRKQP